MHDDDTGLTAAEKEAVKDRLDELYGLIGQPEYKRVKIQNEIVELEKALGDQPIVGSGGRYA